jgi:DNA polymerase III delta prime subunit
MTDDGLAANAAFIGAEIAWFRELLEQRFRIHGGSEPTCDLVTAMPPPALAGYGGPYAGVVRGLGLGVAERLVLILAYLPHIRPDLLDPFLIQNQSVQRRFTEFGGFTGNSHGGFLPTAETALFLLAGENIEARLRWLALFGAEHVFQRRKVLVAERRHQDEPPLSAALTLAPEYVERLATGRPYHPPFSPEFPAQRITTAYQWDDLVLDRSTREDVEEIVAWIRHEAALMEGWQLNRRLKAGFRSLFYGPPGTGKTLTACLLGKVADLPVYRVDLSKVVSKYIGETEKNLASLFDHAQNQNWILFFDEADALFGKRTESRNANDHHANQQIAYLLQRIEDFPGVVILATNVKAHLDEAFARRFQSVVLFRMPSFEQRLRLWEDNFKDKPYRLGADVDLIELARNYELSGGAIINVLRYACLKAVVRTPSEIRSRDLVFAVRRELHKEGKFLD